MAKQLKYKGIHLETYYNLGVDYVNLFSKEFLGCDETLQVVHSDGTHDSLIHYISSVIYNSCKVNPLKSITSPVLNWATGLPRGFTVSEEDITLMKYQLQLGVILWVEQNEEVRDMLINIHKEMPIIAVFENSSVGFLKIRHTWVGNSVLDMLELLKINLKRYGYIKPCSDKFISDGEVWKIFPKSKGDGDPEGD